MDLRMVYIYQNAIESNGFHSGSSDILSDLVMILLPE